MASPANPLRPFTVPGALTHTGLPVGRLSMAVQLSLARLRASVPTLTDCTRAIVLCAPDMIQVLPVDGKATGNWQHALVTRRPPAPGVGESGDVGIGRRHHLAVGFQVAQFDPEGHGGRATGSGLRGRGKTNGPAQGGRQPTPPPGRTFDRTAVG